MRPFVDRTRPEIDAIRRRIHREKGCGRMTESRFKEYSRALDKLDEIMNNQEDNDG